jgi:hypothetical protein
MKTKLILAMAALLVCGCREKTESSRFEEPTERQQELLSEVEIAADSVAVNRARALNHPDSQVAGIDYEQALRELDAAKEKAAKEGTDELFILGAESKGGKAGADFVLDQQKKREQRRED